MCNTATNFLTNTHYHCISHSTTTQQYCTANPTLLPTSSQANTITAQATPPAHSNSMSPSQHYYQLPQKQTPSLNKPCHWHTAILYHQPHTATNFLTRKHHHWIRHATASATAPPHSNIVFRQSTKQYHYYHRNTTVVVTSSQTNTMD